MSSIYGQSTNLVEAARIRSHDVFHENVQRIGTYAQCMLSVKVNRPFPEDGRLSFMLSCRNVLTKSSALFGALFPYAQPMHQANIPSAMQRMHIVVLA